MEASTGGEPEGGEACEAIPAPAIAGVLNRLRSRGGRVIAPGGELRSESGRVNGRGRGVAGRYGASLGGSGGPVNGNGLVNENGLVNGIVGGFGEGGKAGPRKAGRGLRLALAAFLAAAIVLILPTASIFMSPAHEGIAVDGDFSDWRGRTVLGDGPDPSVTNPDVDIGRYAATLSDSSACFYAQVRGRALRTNGPEEVWSLSVFLDIDSSETSGFSISGIGADYRLEALGWDGYVKSATLHRLTGAGPGGDWSGWSVACGAAAAARMGEIELAVSRSSLGPGGTQDFSALFHSQNSPSGESDMGRALSGPRGGALVVSGEALSPGVLPIPLDRRALLRFNMTALGEAVRVERLVLTRSGSAPAESVGEIRLVNSADGRELAGGRFSGQRLELEIGAIIEAGRTEFLDVMVDIPRGALNASSFGAGLAGHDAVTVSKGRATVLTRSWPVSYLSAPQQDITIDGAFADWAGALSKTDERGDCKRADLDLLETMAVKKDQTLSLFARVDGTMFGGPSALRGLRRPGPSEPPRPQPRPHPSGPGPAPAQPASDFFEVFIDADMSPWTGYFIEDSGAGAELMLRVTGAGGRILDSGAFRWSGEGGEWIRLGDLPAAKDTSRMELQAPLALLGLSGASSFAVIVIASDWAGGRDIMELPLALQDPLQLDTSSAIYHSPDGLNWTHQTNISQGSTFKDLCTDSSGYAYAIDRDGAVYKSTGNWSSWSKIINAGSEYFVALTINGSDFYGLTDVGKVYRTSSGNSWSLQGDVGSGDDHVDMCADTNGSLYVIRNRTNETVYVSTDGGKNWGALGNRSVGDDTGLETNIAILRGKVYTFTFNTTPPCGTRNTSLGSAGDVAEVTSVAHAVNLVPEFRDAVLPLVATLLLFVVLRSRRGPGARPESRGRRAVKGRSGPP